MSLSLKAKFLIPTIILFLVGLGVITITSSWTSRTTLQTMLERDSSELNQAISTNVSRWLSSIKRDAAVWSTRINLVNFDPSSRATLKELHAANPLYAGLNTMGTNGIVIYSTNESSEGKLDLSERDYIKTALGGKVGISDINISKVTGLPVVAVAAPLIKDDNIVGAIYMTVNIAALTDYFFGGINTGEHGFEMIFNRMGGFLSHPNMKDLNQKGTVPDYISDMLKAKSGIMPFVDENGVSYIAAFRTEDQLGWVVAVCYQEDELYAPVRKAEMLNMAIGLGMLIIAAIFVFVLVNSITKPLKNTVEIINELAEGEGDLTIRIEAKSRDEVGQLSTALNLFIEKLWQLVSQIKDNSVNINSHADEMNTNNAEINERTQQQAGAIEETSSALEEMTSSVQNNAASAVDASQKADQTYKLAKEGGDVLSKTMVSMKDVTDASHKINEVTNVVNEIAFQTNLLALNASVEAARAGEAGRGFAVVAGEVRNLAIRSATAAKEIQDLISDSVNKIQISNSLVQNSGNILNSIIESIQQANETIVHISNASQEQSAGISEISNAVQHMDQGVQRNSVMVANNFNLSSQLAQAAQELVNLVSRFKL